MVRGIGIDIIEIARIRNTVESSGDQFVNRVFTPREIEYCFGKPEKYQHLAARFAAKEAVSKALSTGWQGDFKWKDVEVMNDVSGQPRVTLTGRLSDLLASARVHLSISHSDSHVVAMVVIEEG